MEKKYLTEWQQVWLDAHPHRSAEWLGDRLADGFDIHHIDGDRANNSPDNLVLIEMLDHMRLHGSTLLRKVVVGRKTPVAPRVERKTRAKPDPNYMSKHTRMRLERMGKL